MLTLPYNHFIWIFGLLASQNPEIIDFFSVISICFREFGGNYDNGLLVPQGRGAISKSYINTTVCCWTLSSYLLVQKFSSYSLYCLFQCSLRALAKASKLLS